MQDMVVQACTARTRRLTTQNVTMMVSASVLHFSLQVMMAQAFCGIQIRPRQLTRNSPACTRKTPGRSAVRSGAETWTLRTPKLQSTRQRPPRGAPVSLDYGSELMELSFLRVVSYEYWTNCCYCPEISCESNMIAITTRIITLSSTRSIVASRIVIMVIIIKMFL